MAVTIKTSISGAQDYIPSFGGNREEAEAGNEYWYVRLLPANKTEMRQLLRKPKGQSFVSKTDEEIGCDIISQRVVEIHGLILEDGDGVQTEPKSGVELWQALRTSSTEFTALPAELLQAITELSTLEPGLLKKLNSRSATLHRAMDREIGNAANATRPMMTPES